jgi:hypothetical protein
LTKILCPHVFESDEYKICLVDSSDKNFINHPSLDEFNIDVKLRRENKGLARGEWVGTLDLPIGHSHQDMANTRCGADALKEMGCDSFIRIQSNIWHQEEDFIRKTYEYKKDFKFWGNPYPLDANPLMGITTTYYVIDMDAYDEISTNVTTGLEIVFMRHLYKYLAEGRSRLITREYMIQKGIRHERMKGAEKYFDIRKRVVQHVLDKECLSADDRKTLDDFLVYLHESNRAEYIDETTYLDKKFLVKK